MDKKVLRSAIELCLAVYRITDRFPHEEPLRNRLRAVSVDIIEYLVYDVFYPAANGRFFNVEELKKKLRLLFAYFDIAQMQKWIDAKNFEVLKHAYVRFYEELGGIQANMQHSGIGQVASTNYHHPELSKRQKLVMQFLQKRTEEGATISDIATYVISSERTIAREVKKLMEMGLVQKRGKTKGAKFFSSPYRYNIEEVNSSHRREDV